MKKRTLRSKVKKVIDEIPVECDKLEKLDTKMKDLDERFKMLQNEKYLNLISNKKDFQKKNFNNSKPNPSQYFPNLKEIIRKPVSTPNLHSKKHKNIVREICSHLNKNEMLEVSFISFFDF